MQEGSVVLSIYLLLDVKWKKMVVALGKGKEKVATAMPGRRGKIEIYGGNTRRGQSSPF
jgi:hypothetical protein